MSDMTMLGCVISAAMKGHSDEFLIKQTQFGEADQEIIDEVVAEINKGRVNLCYRLMDIKDRLAGLS